MANDEQKTSVATLYSSVELKREEFKSMLPPGYDIERFLVEIKTAIYRTPDLLECDPPSVVLAAADAATVGLKITGEPREAYLVKWYDKALGRNVAKLTLDWKGFVRLARNNGNVTRVEAEVVYRDDVFEAVHGTQENFLRHVQKFGDRSDKNIVCAYAIAHFKDGTSQFITCDRSDLDKGRNAAKTKMVWDAWYAEMCKKFAVRRLIKFLELDVHDKRISRALELDNSEYEFSDKELPPAKEPYKMPQRKVQPQLEADTVKGETVADVIASNVEPEKVSVPASHPPAPAENLPPPVHPFPNEPLKDPETGKKPSATPKQQVPQDTKNWSAVLYVRQVTPKGKVTYIAFDNGEVMSTFSTTDIKTFNEALANQFGVQVVSEKKGNYNNITAVRRKVTA